jgi:hypothetical protein
MRYVNRQKMLAVVLAVFLLAALGRMVYAACCYPCSVVLDESITLQVAQWSTSFVNTYISRMGDEWQAKLALKITPGVFTSIASGYATLTNNSDSDMRSSLPSQITAMTSKSDYPIIPDSAKTAYADRAAAMAQDVGSKLAMQAFTVAKASYNKTMQADDVLSGFSPTKMDFIASDGVKKDQTNLCMVQGEVLAATLRLMGTKEEFDATLYR